MLRFLFFFTAFWIETFADPVLPPIIGMPPPSGPSLGFAPPPSGPSLGVAPPPSGQSLGVAPPPGSPIPSSMGAISGAFSGASSSVATTAARATEQMCLRNGKGCADTVGNVLDAAISNVISRQSANEAALAAEAVGIRFSPYTGPLIAAAMTTPTIVNKVNSGDKLGAVGTGIDALLKYKVGAAAFTTCAAQAAVATAYFPVIVPTRVLSLECSAPLSPLVQLTQPTPSCMSSLPKEI